MIRFVFAILFALAPLVSAAPIDQQPYRTGMRNSGGRYQLSAKHLKAVIESLRRITSFQEMRFDEAGFLALGERAHVESGSPSARELLIAAVDGEKVFELESHDNSPNVAFANLGLATDYINTSSIPRIEAYPLRMDLADFARLNGGREALAAFDPGFLILHELAHGVWRLRDELVDRRGLGACDESVNLMRRELGLPERQRYLPRVYEVFTLTGTSKRAELIFAHPPRESRPAGRRWSFLWWDVMEVGSPPDLSSHHRYGAAPTLESNRRRRHTSCLMYTPQSLRPTRSSSGVSPNS
jgi:hypothetical protein